MRSPDSSIEVFPPGSRSDRVTWGMCLGMGLAWLALSMWVGWYAVSPGFPDGFQSTGAALGAAGGFGWPFVGQFEGFDVQWGYHWFGWPLLRSWLLPLWSWSPMGDALVLHGLRLLTAGLVARKLARMGAGRAAVLVAFGTVILQKGWFCSMAFLYRPETLAALTLWLAASPLLGGRSGLWRGKVEAMLSTIGLAASPLIHPLAVAATGVIAVFGIWTAVRREGATWARAIGCWGLPAAVGVALLVAYYGSSPIRLEQLMDTLATMSLVKKTPFLALLGLVADVKNLFLTWPCVLFLALMGWLAWRKESRASALTVGVILPISLLVLCFLYLVAGGHPNTGHAAVMAPFMGWLAGMLVGLTGKARGAWLTRAMLVAQVAVCAVPLFLAGAAFIVEPPRSARGIAVQAIDKALSLTTGKVFIPLSLWEAAAVRSPEERRRIRFTTFPNYAVLDRRADYERQVMVGLQRGDVLVTDSMAGPQPDPVNVLPWARSAVLQGHGGWEKVEEFDAVETATARLGPLRRREMQIGSLAISRRIVSGELID
jgi:hypothetical protein